MPIDTEQVRQFMAALSRAPEAARLRAFFHVDNPRKRRDPTTRKPDKGRKGPLDFAAIAQWQAEGRGVYLVVNPGGDTDAEITHCVAFFLEWDHRPVDWQVTAWQELGLPQPSLVVLTGGKSAHLYWILSEPIPVDQWRAIQTRLLDFANADRTLKNPSRVMRLPGCAYMDATGSPIGQVELIDDSGLRYLAADIDALIPAPDQQRAIELGRGNRDRTEFPTATLDDIRDALNKIPPAVPKAGERPFWVRLTAGLIRACEEAGANAETAQALIEAHSPGFREAYQMPSWKFEAINANTFWYWARRHGWTRAHHAATAPSTRSGINPDATPKPTQAEPPSKPPSEQIAELFAQLLALLINPGDSWAKEHAIRADLWKMGVPSAAIDDRIYYALATQWGLPLQASHSEHVTRGRKLSDPVESQAEDLIPGFLLWRRDHLLFGAGGTGKTLAAAALSVCCIKGQPFLDQEILPSRTGKVLWIGTDAGEGARAMVCEYLEDLGAADDQAVIDNLTIWTAEATDNLSPWACTPAGLLELKTELETGGYALVVIDSLKAVLELANINFGIGPVGTIMRLMQALVCRHCSLLWLHHPAGGKAAGKGLTAAAGNQNINQIPSAVHQITRKTDERGQSNVWTVHKLRGSQGREFSYKLSDEGLAVSEGQITQNARAAILDSIELRIAQGIPTTTVFIHQEMPRFNESTIRNNLTWLRKRGLLKKAGKNWLLTPQGRKYLSLSQQGADIDHWLSGQPPSLPLQKRRNEGIYL